MDFGHSSGGRSGARRDGLLETLAAAAAQVRDVGRLPLVEAVGVVDELLVVQDVKGGAVGVLRLLVAPMPEGAEDGGAALAQVVAAGDAPERIGVALLDHGGGGDGALARLLEPLPAAELAQFALEELRELEQVSACR